MQVDFKGLYFEKHLNLLNEEEVNFVIKQNELDTNKISDGYHTFGELYDHRIVNFILVCRREQKVQVWRSKAHSDGSSWGGWFILGIGKDVGHQITYHLPESYWEQTGFAETLDKAPEWDGHTSADVLERLKQLVTK
jgi:hypothetical protein